MNRRKRIEEVRDRYGLLAMYLFGSRADDGLRLLGGEDVRSAGGDLDIAVLFLEDKPDLSLLGEIQMALEDVFDPLSVDLVPLHRVDPIFQFRAIDGHRITVSDSTRADFYELGVMRQASELLPVQRQLERDLFGVSTS